MKFTVYVARKGLFIQLPSPIHAPEALLWRAVIDRVLHDTASKDEVIRAESKEWFNIHNEDFKTVCELALLNADEVYKTYHRKLKRLIQQNKDVY